MATFSKRDKPHVQIKWQPCWCGTVHNQHKIGQRCWCGMQHIQTTLFDEADLKNSGKVV